MMAKQAKQTRYTLTLDEDLRQEIVNLQEPGETSMAGTLLRLIRSGILLAKEYEEISPGRLIVNVGGLKSLLTRLSSSHDMGLSEICLLLIAKGIEGYSPDGFLSVSEPRHWDNWLWRIIECDRNNKNMTVTDYAVTIARRVGCDAIQLLGIIAGDRLPNDRELIYIGSELRSPANDLYTFEQLKEFRDGRTNAKPKNLGNDLPTAPRNRPEESAGYDCVS